MSDHAVVADLAAKQSITEVIYRYCRALDRMDLAMAATIWHPDGTADYGPTMFQGTGAGFITWVWEQHAAMQAHSHQISNVLIEVDGARAASEAYVTAALRTESGPDAQLEIVSRGRYVDRWSRRDSGWAIDHRVFVEDFTTFSEVTNPPPGPSVTAARRNDQDPSYAALLR
jgi:SnoaL-like domain